jgi:osmotically-inducible protein OsmY
MFNNLATDLIDMLVSIRNGIVLLSGKVDLRQEENICLLVSGGVPDAKGVVSKIGVMQKPKRPYDEIKREIQSRLVYDVWINDTLIEVKVIRGYVESASRVCSLVQKTRAFRKNWISGVKSIEDKNLLVAWSCFDNTRRPMDWTKKSGEEIMQTIEEAFAYDPRISHR